MHASGQLGSALLATVLAVPLWAQPPAAPSTTASAPMAEPAVNLIRDVVYNESHSRDTKSLWEYRSERITPDLRVVREHVETTQGTVFRTVEQNGMPLDDEQLREEERRIEHCIHNPGDIARVAREHREDEDRLIKGLEILPQAMIFEYRRRPSPDLVEIAFRPNPSWSPSGFEEHIVHALTGTVLVNARLKRLVEVRGTVSERVDFGFGMLGHVEKGGTFMVHRQRVGDASWRTDVVDVHLQGKILLLKSLSKDQRETRTDFRQLPNSITLVQAKDMLDHAAGEVAQMRALPTTAEVTGNER
jgi:hypothetical protein